MANETIKVQIDMNEAQSKYKCYYEKEDFYGTPEYYIAYHNYRKSKGNPAEDLLSDLATGAIKSGFDAIRHVFNKSFDKAARKAIDSAVREAAIESGGTWTD